MLKNLSFQIKKQARDFAQSKDPLTIRGEMFCEVDFKGTSFGEMALQNDKPRAATVSIKSDDAILIALNRRNFKKLLDAHLKAEHETAVAKIRQFELFKPITRLKMNNLRFYFHEKTYKRGQYLYRQGDILNGVFCILEGEARLIKETWTLTNQNDPEPAPVINRQRGSSQDVAPLIDETKECGLTLINDIKRKMSKELDVAIFQRNEVVGTEEIILKLKRRQHTLKAHTENVTVLFISHDNFLERVFNPHSWLKHTLCEKIELQGQFHDQLESDYREFNSVFASLPDKPENRNTAKVVKELSKN